jgi:hypothetical protein
MVVSVTDPGSPSPGRIQRAIIDPASGALTEWEIVGLGFDLQSEIDPNSGNLGIIAATAGPKGAYFVTEAYPRIDPQGSNYVLGIRFNSDGSYRDSRVVSRMSSVRNSTSVTFVHGDYFYSAGGTFTFSNTDYRNDIHMAALEP